MTICKTPLKVINALEPLRLQERVDEIAEDGQCGQSGENVVHREFLEPFAGLGEPPTANEEQQRDSDVDQIKHKILIATAIGRRCDQPGGACRRPVPEPTATKAGSAAGATQSPPGSAAKPPAAPPPWLPG